MITITNNEGTPTLLEKRFVGSTPVKAIAKGDEYLYRDTKDLNFSFRLVNKIPNGFAKINRIQGNTVVWNQGSLRNVQMQGIKSVVFNQWDEKWEVGAINISDGLDKIDNECIRSKNFIPVIPLKEYYSFVGTGTNIRVIGYDENKSYCYNYSFSDYTTNQIFTIQKNIRYIRFYTRVLIANYNNNICINISDTEKNGTYEPYKGNNINLDVTNITSPNIWDELWELGTIDVNGDNDTSSSVIRSTNFIEVIFGILYYIKSSENVDIYYYNLNNTFLSKTSSSIRNSTFTPPNNCKYIKIVINETKYKKDVCINLNDTNINGTYFPHKPFADGMKSIDTLRDEITTELVILRIGSVDLGDLDWTLVSTGIFLSETISNIATRGGVNNYSNPQIKMMVSNTYTISSITKLSSELNDLEITINAGGASTFVIRNDSCSTASDLLTALSGIILNYELLNPVIFDRKTDLLYLATNGGTEEILFEGISPILDITYNGLKDIYYGIEFDETISSPDCTRIGNMLMHKTLPIHSRMKGCLLNDDGEVVKYLNPNDWTSETRDGSLGLVMVEIPMHYRKFETDGTKHRVLISEYPLPGYHLVKKQYVSAYQATVDRANNKLSSVVNTTALYRGGNNNAYWDELSKSLLGKPATSISRTNFRTYARNRKANSTEWNCMTYDMQKTLYWLFVIEYATLNSQKAYNAQLDSNGYRQGGLGNGVTTINNTKWNSFNSYNPFIPCGHTDSLGNSTGVVTFTMPEEYDSENTVTVSVPRYRGVENPFGHIWQWTDGINVRINPTAANGGNDLSEVFVCSDPSKFKDDGYDDYTLVGHEARTDGYVKKIIFGEGGEIIPSEVGGGSTTYFCDYHYTNIPTTVALRGVFFGCYASYGAFAGFAFASSNSAPSSASAHIGSRLCYIQ